MWFFRVKRDSDHSLANRLTTYPQENGDAWEAVPFEVAYQQALLTETGLWGR